MSAHSLPAGVGPVPTSVQRDGILTWVVLAARVLNLVLRGKLNAVTTVTLTASGLSTTLTDDRIGINSTVQLEAQTASAATARLTAPGIYVVCAAGSATIHHPSNAATDQTFSALIIG